MRKRFIKFRVFRVIPTFESCRSKDPSTFPANPAPSFPRFSPANSTNKTTHPQPNSKPHRSFLKRHVSSAFLSARRGILGSHSHVSFPEDSRTKSSSRFRRGKDPKWHTIAEIPDYSNDHSTPPRRKIYNSAASEDENDIVLFPPLQLKSNRRRTRARRRRSFQKIRMSTSSDSGLFSEEDDDQEREDEETDALVSSDDSSTPAVSIASKIKAKKNKKNRRSFRSTEEEVSASPAHAPARLSEFMRRMVPCKAVEGKVRESFAVVKKSENPYEDFKRSMAEMVVEKQMFEAEELEELLRCFLSLNSVHHHEAIVRAFAEMWEALFCQSNN